MDITALTSPSLSLSVCLSLSLSLFYSLFLSLSTFYLLFYFYFPAKQGVDDVRTHTHTHSLVYTHLHLLKEPAPASRKKITIFTIRSILSRPIGFQLPGLNLEANEVDASLCPLLHPKSMTPERAEGYIHNSLLKSYIRKQLPLQNHIITEYPVLCNAPADNCV